MNLFIKTTPKAEQDLDDLFQYLAKENEDIALRFFDSFRETIAQLSKMPNMGKDYQVFLFRENLEHLLIEGLDSGQFITITDEWLNQKEKELINSIYQKK